MKHSIRFFMFFVLLTGGFSLILPTFSAQATPYTVTTTLDENDGECTRDCSLRDAILLANATTAEDTIELEAGTYTLTLGSLSSTKKLILTGAGAGETIIDASGMTNRILSISSDTTISGITFKNGYAPSTSTGSYTVSQGGAIYSATSDINITILDCEFKNNKTHESATLTNGGAIYNYRSSLFVDNTLFENNSSGKVEPYILIVGVPMKSMSPIPHLQKIKP